MAVTLTFEQIIQRISNALSEADGDYVAVIHNKICDEEIKYLEDSVWEVKE